MLRKRNLIRVLTDPNGKYIECQDVRRRRIDPGIWKVNQHEQRELFITLDDFFPLGDGEAYEYTGELRLFRTSYANGAAIEIHVARDINDVNETVQNLVGTDEELPEEIKEYPPTALIAIGDEEGFYRIARAATWANTQLEPTMLASTEY